MTDSYYRNTGKKQEIKEEMSNKKYELIKTSVIKLHDKKLYRIRALKDFSDVKKGDLGGYVESEDNLSQDGDCWIYDNAKVYDNAKIFHNAKVYQYADICQDAEIYDNAKVYEDAQVYGWAEISEDMEIHGDARIYHKDSLELYIEKKNWTEEELETIKKDLGRFKEKQEIKMDKYNFEEEEEVGLRFNSNKIELDYCPRSAIASVALVLMKNSKKHGGKYPDNNWRKGMSTVTYMNSTLRHIYRYLDGEDIDTETLLPHLFHAITNLAMVIENVEMYGDKFDDRLCKNDIESNKLEDFTKKYLKGDK